MLNILLGSNYWISLDYLRKINKSSDDFEEKFWDSKSAETFYNSLPAKVDDPMAIVFKDTMESLLKKNSKVI